VNGNGRFNDGLEVTHVANDNNRKYLHFGKFENFVSNIPYIQGSGTGTGYNMALNPYNGNVGIGTTTPGDKLEVNGGNILLKGNTPRIKFYSNNDTYKNEILSNHSDIVNYGLQIYTPITSFWYSTYHSYCFIQNRPNQDRPHGQFYLYYGYNDGSERNVGVFLSASPSESNYINNGGKVGIGTNSPSYPLDVRGYVNTSAHGYYGIYENSSRDGGGGVSANVGSTDYTNDGYTRAYYTNIYVGIRTTNGVWCGSIVTSSDERIKTNIQDVSDNIALQQLRDISCCFYEYKDKVIKGTEKTIGFIAQQVREHMPMAVSIQKGIIPNEMRKIENPQWTTLTDASGNNTYKLTISDLEDASGNTSETTKYRFYVSNDPSGNDECEKEITSLENEPKSFIFQEQWQNVFLYGKEMDDFHTLDKQKLFAINFSASQEIDRIQQQEKTKLEEQTSKLEEQTSKLEEQTSKLAEAQAEIATLKTTLVDVLSRLAALEN
jgi:hypothetical protein